MKTVATLFGLVFILHSTGVSQQLEISKAAGVADELLQLIAEDQFGDVISYPGSDNYASLIFFMPKPDSRSEGEERLGEIARYIRFVEDNMAPPIQTLLIIEPYYTGIFFDRAIDSRLRDESYSAVTDQDGDLIRQAHPEPGGLFFWIVDQFGKIKYVSSTGFGPNEWAEAVLHLEKSAR